MVYDFVHIVYDLDGIPFSREVFAAYVVKHHGTTEDHANELARRVGLPSEEARGTKEFDDSVAAPRTFPQPFILKDVRLSSQNLPDDERNKYTVKTLGRVANGLARIGWIKLDDRNAEAAIGLPKYHSVRVTNELRRVFEEAVRAAQHQSPPTDPEPPNKWVGLAFVLMTTFFTFVGQPGYRGQSNVATPIFDTFYGLPTAGVTRDVLGLTNSDYAVLNNANFTKQFKVQIWDAGVDEVNTQHQDLWGGVLQNVSDYGCPHHNDLFATLKPDTSGYGFRLAGVDEVNTLHQDLWGSVLKLYTPSSPRV